MDLQSQNSLDLTLGDFINDVHIKQPTTIPEQVKSLVQSPIYFALISLLNTQNNHLLQSAQTLNNHSQKYFERKDITISKELRKVGHLVKIIAGLCQFQDPREELLAIMETVRFYQFFNQNSSQYPPYFIDFMKGIFPVMNVHRDNVPLYIPFHESFENYHSSSIGNPNWELARQNLDIFYKEQAMSQNSAEELWYLIFTSDKMILNKFQDDLFKKIWAHLYYFYVAETLKPHQTFTKPIHDHKINIQSIHQLIKNKKLSGQTSGDEKLLLCLVLYMLTDDFDELDIFLRELQGQIGQKIGSFQSSMNDQGLQLSVLGLINCISSQLLNILIQIEGSNVQNQNIQKIQKMQSLLSRFQQFAVRLVEKRVPYHDYYLRTVYSSNTQDRQLNQQNDNKILEILLAEIDKEAPKYEFPRYLHFPKSFYQKFSEKYLQKCPTCILEIYDYLPHRQALWSLFQCQQLRQIQTFEQIRILLQQRKSKYLEIEPSLKQSDFNQFILVWDKYHRLLENQLQTLSFKYMKNKIHQGLEVLNRITNTPFDSSFREKVHLPFSRGQNVMKFTNYLIEGFDETYLMATENESSELERAYLSFLLNPLFKTYLLPVLNDEQKNKLWEKWTSVYIADKSLVSELMGINEENSQQKPKQGNKSQIIEFQRIDEENKPKASSINQQIMQIQ